MLTEQPRITACLWKRYSTVIAPGSHGAICLKGSEIFAHLAQDADNEYAMIDSTIVRAHQHAAEARKKSVMHGPVIATH